MQVRHIDDDVIGPDPRVDSRWGMRVLTRALVHRALVAVWVVAFMVVSPFPALSHPSDFETLTIDLLFGTGGLHAIDAAVVVGPSYEPGPSVELRDMVAHQVLEALDLSEIPIDIDLENSERYHWVGFTIRFPDPSLDGRPTLEVDTRPLQDIAADLGVEHLKLSICHGFSESADPRDDFGCEGRILTPDEESLLIALSVRDELPRTGQPMAPLMIAALALVATGFFLVTRQKS